MTSVEELRRIAAAMTALGSAAEAEAGRAVRIIAADPFTQDNPESFVGQLLGWLEGAAMGVQS